MKKFSWTLPENVKPVRTRCEIERVAMRAAYRRGVRQLCVYTQEIYQEPTLVAIITTSTEGITTWRDVTCNGGLTPPQVIHCNGSVSKKTMRDMLGVDLGTTVFAKVLHYSDLKYKRYTYA